MQYNIEFAPFLPVLALTLMGLLALLLSGLHIWRFGLSGVLRAIAWGILILLLANPSLREDTTDPLTDIAVILVDRSQSQGFGKRAERTVTALADLTAQFARQSNLETEIVEMGRSRVDENAGTVFYKELQNTLASIPTDRLAGIFVITDGQVHDMPELESEDGTLLDHGINAPLHTLITGERKEVDRKLSLVKAPRFGIVGELAQFTVRIDDFGTADPSDYTAVSMVRVTATRDGEPAQSFELATGTEHQLSMRLTHGGESIVEFRVESLNGELTELNNSAVILINGVRDRLRVLLVSGEPHNGERTWRNLLKADPSVDLVHFTILRPPEKQDGTPTEELSLISFPTRQLFAQKLNEFDLVIFDRYRRRGVLPVLYLANIARYVAEGGALLTAAGPSFATPYSLFRTPLAEVLPARPSGQVIEEGFRPKVSEDGARHPVTAGLAGANDPLLGNEAEWGRWFRLVGVDKLSGETVLEGPDGKPLLILDRFGEGRVAQMMSDHAWLWARGYEGGGPQAELLRRLAHWLMKEPELEEEVLRAVIEGQDLRITRRTMAPDVPGISITSPTGEKSTLALAQSEPGLWTGSQRVEGLGLYHITDGRKTALAVAGPVNPREYADILSTDETLTPLVLDTGGRITWLSDEGTPDIRNLTPGRSMKGTDWVGIKRNGAYVVTDTRTTPLMPALLALLLALGFLVWAWRREAG